MHALALIGGPWYIIAAKIAVLWLAGIVITAWLLHLAVRDTHPPLQDTWAWEATPHGIDILIYGQRLNIPPTEVDRICTYLNSLPLPPRHDSPDLSDTIEFPPFQIRDAGKEKDENLVW